MKRIISGLSGLLLTTALWGGEYWIQVLSIDAAGEIEGAFTKRIDKLGYTHETIVESGRKKVRIGTFSDYQKARGSLGAIRCQVATDAFIVEEASIPAVETVPRELAVIRPATMPEKKNEVASSEPKSGPMQAEPKAVTVPEQAESGCPKAAPCTCICDRHALRKAEISAALSYYKNSPNYRFDPSEEGWSK